MWSKLFDEIALICQNHVMASIRTFDFKKRRHFEITFTTLRNVFVDALCVKSFITDCTSVVATSVTDSAFRLTNVVFVAAGASKGIKKIHGVACKMMSYFEILV